MSHYQHSSFWSRAISVAIPSLVSALMWSSIADARALDSPQDACQFKDVHKHDVLVQVPFELIDGRIYVQAEVNGSYLSRFAVDTGASGTARADSSLVRALGLAVQGQAGNSDGVRTVQANTVHIESIRLGGLQRKNIDAITRDYNSQQSSDAHFSGILAREFFGDGLLIVNYPNRTLAFTRSLVVDPTGRNVLTYDRAFRIPVMIGNLQVQGNLDTGANVALLLPREVYDKISSTPITENTTAQLSNGAIETGRTIVAGPVQISELNLSNIEARVSTRYPEVLVGAYALQTVVLMIDQRSNAISICK